MKFLKTAVKIFKKILFVAECCILAHILVFWICWTISEIYSRIVHTDQQILSAILFHSDEIVILIFFIEVTVFINYTAFRLFGDIFEIDKRNMYYGIGFVSTASLSVYLFHRASQYYGTVSSEPLNFIICVFALVLFYYAYAGMSKKRRGADRQNEKPAGQITGSGNANYCFPAMSIMLLVFTIAVTHWKYSGHVFLTPRMLAWIAYFLSFIAIVFFFLHIPTPLF